MKNIEVLMGCGFNLYESKVLLSLHKLKDPTAKEVCQDSIKTFRSLAKSLRIYKIPGHVYENGAIKATFQKMARLVRDVYKGRQRVRLEVSGEETELDKTVIEEIGDPLVHIIETSGSWNRTHDERIAKGKPAGALCD